MAAGILSAPGTKFGPCAQVPGDGFCQHTDCAQTRADAASICRICTKPIGYETRFYVDRSDPALGPPAPLVHAVCLETS